MSKLIIRKVFGTSGDYSEVSVPAETFNQLVAWDVEKKTNPYLAFNFVKGARNHITKEFDFNGVKVYTDYDKTLKKLMPIMIKTSDLDKVDLIPSVSKSVEVSGLAFRAIVR